MIFRTTFLFSLILAMAVSGNDLFAQTSENKVLPVVNFYYPKNAYRIKVSEEIQTYIDKLKSRIEGDDAASIKLIGFAYDGSNKEWNTRVSKYRVRALRDILIANGISKNRIEIEYLGKSKPIAKDNSAKELAKNRRVELRIEA